jgi:SM-20-related protein
MRQHSPNDKIHQFSEGQVERSGPFLSAFRRAAGVDNTRPLLRSASTVLRVVIFNDFLPIAQLNEITAYALANERLFIASGVMHSSAALGTISTQHRRSRVLADLGPLRTAFLNRLLAVFPGVVVRLSIPAFRIRAVSTEVTATNDGEFFCRHTDNGHYLLTSRQLSFSYFFHREPAPFSGGELLIYHPESRLAGEPEVTIIIPRRNSIVFFPSGVMHEIAPVSVSSRLFRDSRFTVNGWFYR